MIEPRALLRLGVRSLMLHKLRSTLSILGVVFGVAAVVSISSVGEGARREALAQVGQLGIDSVTVRARSGAGAAGAGLSLADAESIRNVVPGILGVAAVREAPLEAAAGARRIDVTAVGTTPGYRVAARLPLAEGRFLADLDVRDSKRVAVLGASVARALFPLGQALGERVELAGDAFDVVGVLEARAMGRSRAASPIRSRDVNRAVFVPLRSLDRGGDGRPEGIDEIVVRVADAERVAPAAEVVRSLLRRTGGGDFEVVVPREILRQKERTQRIFNVVIGAVAAISLLVGGIGIMNIMLASVAERRREVGVRRALGATRQDVAAQFLVESSLLTVLGGLAGALLGTLGSLAIQHLAGWPTALSPGMLLLALLMALGVGIGFGFYPAWHAAQLDPMEALRTE